MTRPTHESARAERRIRGGALVAAAAPTIAVLALALGAAAFVVMLSGGDPLRALGALARGAFGGRYQILTTLTKSCPLILTGLAASIAFRTGFWNIGAEGQLIAGAVAAVAASLALAALSDAALVPALMIPASLAAAAAAGGALALAAAFLKLRRGAHEVITTILLNFVALHFLSYCVNGPLQERAATQPVSELIPAAARLPRIAGSANPLHAGIVIAVVLAIAAYVLLFRTAAGLELRAVGLAPNAARHARIPVGSRIAVAALLSGGAAGLAGAIEIAGNLHRLYDKISPGYGYTGIAVSLLARNHPIWVIPAALFFGALDAGATRMQREAGVSYLLVLVVQAIVIVAAAVAAARRAAPRNAPSSATPEAEPLARITP
jgi:simple sugar transport system permease protein